jgi:hypothetical protein
MSWTSPPKKVGASILGPPPVKPEDPDGGFNFLKGGDALRTGEVGARLLGPPPVKPEDPEGGFNFPSTKEGQDGSPPAPPPPPSRWPAVVSRRPAQESRRPPAESRRPPAESRRPAESRPAKNPGTAPVFFTKAEEGLLGKGPKATPPGGT